MAALAIYSTSLLFEDTEMGGEVVGPERGASRDDQSDAHQENRYDVYWQGSVYLQCQNGSIMRYPSIHSLNMHVQFSCVCTFPF